MTVPAQTTLSNESTANGLTTSFPYEFMIASADDLTVELDGVETTTGFTVTGVGDEVGGAVVFSVAPANGVTVLRYLDPVFDRAEDYQALGEFAADVVNRDFDRLWLAMQGVALKLGLCVRAPISGSAVELPTPVANNVIGWNSAANGFENYAPSDNTLLSAILSSYGGAGNIGFSHTETYSAGTIGAKAKQAPSVKDAPYLAAGDGVTSDQAGIADAVAACYASGDWLWWPEGTFVSTANIPHFHNVKHFGPGVVKRGSNTFSVSCLGSTVNNLYVSASGSASNDGLSSSEPMSESSIPTALANYGPLLDGVWRFYLAAGSYAGGMVTTGIRSKNYIEFYGASVGGHPNVPTTIIDGTGSSSDHGWFFQDRMTVKVQDIKFQNWTTKSYSHGLCAVGHAKLYTVNVHSQNVNYGGIDVEDHSNLILSGGIHNNTGYSIRATYHSTVSLGYQGTVSTNRPQISGGRTGGAGIWLTEYSQGHIDYCDIFDCNSSGGGVQLTNHSRADINYTVFGAGSANYYNLRADTMSTFIDNASNTWNTPIIKNIVLWGNSLDWGNNQNVYFDQATGRLRVGPLTSLSPIAALTGALGSSGASINTNSSIIGEHSGTNYLTLASPGNAGTESGLLIAKPSSPLFGKWVYDFTDNAWKMAVSSAVNYEFAATYFIPRADNTKTLGSGSFRWSTVYAATGAINTSDAREKQQIRDISVRERAVAIRLKSLFRAFKFNDAVEAKGEKARIHFGVIAQDVKAAFEAEGLVAEDYAILCYDEWEEQQEVIESWDDEFDEENNLVRRAGSIVVESYRPAGNRYGVRYDELFAFILCSI